MKGIPQHSSAWDRPPASRSASLGRWGQRGGQPVGCNLIPSLEGASVVLGSHIFGLPPAFSEGPGAAGWKG